MAGTLTPARGPGTQKRPKWAQPQLLEQLVFWHWPQELYFDPAPGNWLMQASTQAAVVQGATQSWNGNALASDQKPCICEQQLDLLQTEQGSVVGNKQTPHAM
jgi:hypothetical protein